MVDSPENLQETAWEQNEEYYGNYIISAVSFAMAFLYHVHCHSSIPTCHDCTVHFQTLIRPHTIREFTSLKIQRVLVPRSLKTWPHQMQFEPFFWHHLVPGIHVLGPHFQSSWFSLAAISFFPHGFPCTDCETPSPGKHLEK